MKNIIRKLTSRKLWAAIAGLIVGIATLCGADTDTIRTIAGAAVSVISVVAYIVAEGRIDAAHVAEAATAVETLIGAVEGSEPDESTEMEVDTYGV